MADNHHFDSLKPRITVIGVGGAGGNAVNNMIRSKLEGVEFIVCNTDAQALKGSLTERRIQIGTECTEGLGAGSKPEVGRASAEEDLEELQKQIKGSHMLFITAGMGGGTGTGAAPVIARTARDMGILTVGVVTKPFHFEGTHRMKTAERGIDEMQQHVDTLIVIPNQNLFRIANDRTTFADAFNMADHVLYSGVRGVTDLMIMPGLINLDFADVRTVMAEMGKAMMGTGEASSDNRAIEAAEAAISNPLLDDVSMRGAKGVLINITGGLDMTLFEVDEAANRIREEVDSEANIIFGSTFDERMSGLMRVSVVATGIESKNHMSKSKVVNLQKAGSFDAKSQETSPELNFRLGRHMGIDESQEDNTTPPSLSVVDNSVQELEVEVVSIASLDENSMTHENQHVAAVKEEKPSFLRRLGFGSKPKKEEIPREDRWQDLGNHSPKEAMSSTQPTLDVENLDNNEDVLEIPAFLRKGNVKKGDGA